MPTETRKSTTILRIKVETREFKEILYDTIKNNPDYQLFYFDSLSKNNFICEQYPEYKRQYDMLIPGAYKADLFRYLILYHYGGVYSDLPQRYLLPLNQIILGDDEMVLIKDDPNFQNIFS